MWLRGDGTHSAGQRLLASSLGDGNQSGFLLIALLDLPGAALPEFPPPARCRRPTLQLSRAAYPPIDHALKVRQFLSACMWVCGRGRPRRSVLSCWNETEFMSRNRQFLLPFGAMHEKEVRVSVFLGTQFQRVCGVCVPRRKDFRARGRAERIHAGKFRSAEERRKIGSEAQCFLTFRRWNVHRMETA